MKPYTVIEVGRAAVDHLVRAHYLHKWPGVVVSTLALMDGHLPIGAIIFSLPTLQISKRYGGQVVWELARLFITDTTPKNTESWFISRAVKWVQRNHPEVHLLVSYADPSAGHCGTIYRASNWIDDGMTMPRPNDKGVSRTDETLFGSVAYTKTYGRLAHVPKGATKVDVPRVSKPRFIYWLDGKHERRRNEAPMR